MKTARRAVIDIGTNSVKLLVVELNGQDLRPVIEESLQTRLGDGFYKAHKLQPGPIAATAEAVASFAAKARDLSSGSIHVIATSAARDAVNRDDLTNAVERASGLTLQIISGEQEAEWAFLGVRTDSSLSAVSLLLLDVGGGSSEFIVGQGEHIAFRESFPVGTVRLLNAMPHGDPPATNELAGCREWLRKFLEREVAPHLVAALKQQNEAAPAADVRKAMQCVGTGGTASILGCMEAQLATFDRKRLESIRLNLDRLRWHTERLWSLPLERRKQIVGLPQNRADVILYGSAIYEAVLERFGFAELRVSTRGLRFGAVMANS